MKNEVSGFFSPNYKTPHWFRKKFNRRQFLKTTAASAVVASAPISFAASSKSYQDLIALESWKTLDAVQQHLLPESDTGPGAKALNALVYLYNVTQVHGLEPDEVEFIFKGVGWLNGFTQQSYKLPFTELRSEDKEAALRRISQSRAGENWISTIITYLLEAMLAPPSYGGNPSGIGWQWLDHQPGFPLPKAGQRFYELPGQTPTKAQKVTSNNHHFSSDIPIQELPTKTSGKLV